jgi:uncharacterized protein YbdZ (MbtH family)
MTEVVPHEVYRVVRNDEEQYSIWPARQDPPPGWQATGFEGDKDACLAHIDEVWTDMRPLSLRRALESAAAQPPAAAPDPPVAGPDLVTRLSTGEHRVEVVLRPEPSLPRLRTALDNRYLHLRFPDTGGGTELGMRLVDEETDLSGADLHAGTGTMRVTGDLTLDFQPVRCQAVVDVAQLTGEGHLRRR